MSLLFISQQFTIYIGFCLLIAGTVGNAINIFIFSSVRTYRTTPCTFYFLIGSLSNLLYIMINLTIRIMAVGYDIDLSNTSSTWCKIRQFLLVTPGIMTITCSCLAAIDQFLVTSKNAFLRRYSNIKWAHRIMLIVTIIWCLHGISVLLYYDISPISNICTITNAIFVIYSLVYILGFNCALPILSMIIFGWLTYRNIHRTIALAEHNADRQLIRMTLIQIGLVVISFIPYGIYNIYILITARIYKDKDRLMKEYFTYTIISLMAYFYYTVCLSRLCLIDVFYLFFFNFIRELFICLLFHQIVFVKQ